MKKLLFSLCAAMVSLLAANSATIHWITFIDTNDDKVGKYDVVGHEVLYGHYINVINSALAEKGYQSKVYDFTGDKVTPENCQNIVNSLQVSPDDIVMFYYIGHGAHSDAEHGADQKWPFMNMCQNYVERMVSLEWVHNTLKSKGARLTASIGMCCNGFESLLQRKSGSPIAANYGNTYMSGNEIEAIQRMFCDYSGDFLATSASPGQFSHAIGDNGALAPGIDVYTLYLVSNFMNASEKGSLDWDALFNKVGLSVDNAVVSIYDRHQQPVFKNNLRRGAAARKPAPKQPEPAVAPAQEAMDITDPNVVGNWFMGNIDYLLDKDVTLSKRRKAIDEMMPLFTGSAQIKTIAQDGDVVIDKQPVRDFLDRVNTSRVLLKIVPDSYTYRNGKIESMKVREYYKK